ncbi:MAG: hypothetical protein P8X79_13890 [Reinekea sp.]
MRSRIQVQDTTLEHQSSSPNLPNNNPINAPSVKIHTFCSYPGHMQ